MSQPCKFGFNCHRTDCWFSHPEGRAIDGQGKQGGAGGSVSSDNAGQQMHGARYPPYQQQYQQEFYQHQFYPSQQQQQQPSPRALIPGQFSPSQFKHIPKPKQEDTASARERLIGSDGVCTCCKGEPFNCPNPDCQFQGNCDCIQEDEEAEAWRDEWKPEARDCACCKGFIYKCKRNNLTCATGVCHCRHQKKEPQA